MEEPAQRKKEQEEEKKKEEEGVDCSNQSPSFRPDTPDSDDSDDSFHTTSGEDRTDSLRLAEQQEEGEEQEEEDGEESPCFTPEPEPPTAEKDKEEEEEDERKDAAKKENEEDDEECFVDEEHLKDLELSMTEEERSSRREESLQHKESGNTSFREGSLQQAVMSYTAGLRICPLTFPKDRAVLYANRAAARAKLNQKKQAIRDCSQAIELDESYTKAVLRRATLNQETDQLDDALKDFQRVVELQPSNQQAQEAIRRLPDMITERNEKLKEEMMGKLKDLGNMFLRPFGLSTSNFELKQDSGSGGYNISFKQNPDNSH
ncbi:tetratricopeptide repeat protein 1-like isoform X2 [Portunus trituberculatus]|nr:tetratricopeptide repeat protein 1-like isoform X2 [Portunus trituberculatus]XP_045105906.1 tetratricopeptide repeat protein 1-like isoform X2 [Portunus trituberculatus]XP_045105907.1 tetratricopeptide repeat protein 1-like isoform X2 [Portunus trituberculatus]